MKIHLVMGFAWVLTEGGPAFPALRSSQLPGISLEPSELKGLLRSKLSAAQTELIYSELLPLPSAQRHPDSAEFASVNPKAEATKL